MKYNKNKQKEFEFLKGFKEYKVGNLISTISDYKHVVNLKGQEIREHINISPHITEILIQTNKVY